jgi:nicotinamide-nucleotide adenylyltransferase
MKALFIGRFQPLHNGHFKVIQNISKDFKELIIGIGSSQYSDIKDNPFSADERKQMIINTLEKADIENYRLVMIPDIHNPPKWVDHVLTFVSDFDVVISNNDLTKKLFREKGFTVKETKLYNQDEYSGKEIRKRIANNEEWEKLVPSEIVKIIKKINGITRIKKQV